MMPKPNILITSAGAKVLLIKDFQDAARSRGGSVIAGDIVEDCAAAHFADSYMRLPRSDALDYIPTLLALCAKNAIGLIVPTRDAEIAVLAKCREQLAAIGTTVPVPSPERLAICQDKLNFAEFLLTSGLPTEAPIDIRRADLSFPLFARPRTGAAGHGARKIVSRDELASLNANDYIVTTYISGAPEYTIDVLSTLDGRALQAVCRLRETVVRGESKISRVIVHPELERLSLRLCEILGLVGHNTVQAFDVPGAGCSFIEVNPRFGGASNLSIRAGLDSPARILAMIAGDRTAETPRPILIGMRMLRYSLDVLVESSGS